MNNKLTKDELLDQIVADYTKRIRAGTAPEIASYKREHPTLADEIEELLSSVAMIEGLKAESESVDDGSDNSRNNNLSSRKQIGEYVLIRELGRGGMGVVFEAVHQSLGRRVALKVMLEKELESEKHIARFHREAQAAAKLHHTNIVSVFGVGESDGYHYYVMEYVDGISLKLAVASSRDQSRMEQEFTAGKDNLTTAFSREIVLPEGQQQPAKSNPSNEEAGEFLLPEIASESWQSDGSRHQWVGKIGAQVADALGYSHAMGILHRDIKPANLMLDENGQVWITDFGLVKIADEEQLTKTGAVLGTPQYMAPESLKGHYDQRSETYCLGLSLYEFATLKPAFASGTHAEVFNRVIHEDPTSPSKIDPSIPRDLATVIEKAISKDPNDRYESAFALRDDLRAFVEDRPISARRPSTIEWAMRWARKNPGLAFLTSLSAALVLATAIISAWAWAATSRAYSNLQAESLKKESALQQAEDNLELANAQQALADMNASFAAESEQEAKQNLLRSETNVKLMVETFDGLFIEYLRGDSVEAAEKFDFDGFNELAGIEISVDENDAGYLKKMADFYERFARQNADNKDLLQDAAKGWRRVANINFLIGDDKAAVTSYEKAVSSYKEILDLNPESTQALINLVSTRSEMSNAVRRGGGEFGLALLKPAKLINQNLKEIENHPDRDNPEVRFALAETLTTLASAEVYRLAAESVVDPDRKSDDRRPGPKIQRPRHFDKHAKKSVERAVKIAGELIEFDPDNIQYRLLQGRSLSSLGALELNFGDREPAVKSLGKASDLFETLSKQHPDNPNYEYQAALTLLLMPTDETDAAGNDRITKVQQSADSLFLKSPRAEYAQLQIVSRLKLADLHLSQNKPQQAIDELKDAVKTYSANELQGAAKKSMVRAMGQTVGNIRQALPMLQRRDFMRYVEAELREHFKSQFPRVHRRGPGRPIP